MIKGTPSMHTISPHLGILALSLLVTPLRSSIWRQCLIPTWLASEATQDKITSSSTGVAVIFSLYFCFLFGWATGTAQASPGGRGEGTKSLTGSLIFRDNPALTAPAKGVERR